MEPKRVSGNEAGSEKGARLLLLQLLCFPADIFNSSTISSFHDLFPSSSSLRHPFASLITLQQLKFSSISKIHRFNDRVIDLLRLKDYQ